MKAYILTENHTVGDTTYEKGLTIYECRQHDYGCASDDTRGLGVEHRSMTLDPTGDYPFFTVPVTKFTEVEAERVQREHPQLRAMHDNEERRFRDRIGETNYARLKEIERTQGLAAARAEARRIERTLEAS